MEHKASSLSNCLYYNDSMNLQLRDRKKNKHGNELRSVIPETIQY